MDIQSEQIDKLIESLAKAQADISVAVYDSVNPHFKNKYASYEALRKACLVPLSSNGLAITHMLMLQEGKRVMVTQLSHTSGQWIRSFLCLPQDRETPQAVGSNITYAKRYTLGAILAMASDEDDDGENAQAPYRDSNTPTQQISTECITSLDAQEIENMIEPEDKEYRADLLCYFSKAFKVVPEMVSFYNLPKTAHKACLRSIKKRYTSKDESAELEQ